MCTGLLHHPTVPYKIPEKLLIWVRIYSAVAQDVLHQTTWAGISISHQHHPSQLLDIPSLYAHAMYPTLLPRVPQSLGGSKWRNRPWKSLQQSFRMLWGTCCIVFTGSIKCIGNNASQASSILQFSFAPSVKHCRILFQLPCCHYQSQASFVFMVLKGLSLLLEGEPLVAVYYNSHKIVLDGC